VATLRFVAPLSEIAIALAYRRAALIMPLGTPPDGP